MKIGSFFADLFKI